MRRDLSPSQVMNEWVNENVTSSFLRMLTMVDATVDITIHCNPHESDIISNSSERRESRRRRRDCGNKLLSLDEMARKKNPKLSLLWRTVEIINEPLPPPKKNWKRCSWFRKFYFRAPVSILYSKGRQNCTILYKYMHTSKLWIRPPLKYILSLFMM